ncbi:LOW QUALITY PROTEIN: transmembrane protein 252 [Phaethornis superciliosus]
MRSTAETDSKQIADRNQVLCPGKMPKGIFTFLCLFVLFLSFSSVCLGALCVSTRSSLCRCGNIELIFYCLLALGCFPLVTGIFWSTFHEILKYRGLSNTFSRPCSCREHYVSTIDSYDFYLPFCEDNTDPEKQSSLLPDAPILKQQEVTNIPPPLYSASAEFISETNRQEQPLPYESSMQQLQQQPTADQDSDHGVEPHSDPSTKGDSYQQHTDCQGTSERATLVTTSETGSE